MPNGLLVIHYLGEDPDWDRGFGERLHLVDGCRRAARPARKFGIELNEEALARFRVL